MELDIETIAIIHSLKGVPDDISELKIRLAEQAQCLKIHSDMIEKLLVDIEGNGKPGLKTDMQIHANKMSTVEERLNGHLNALERKLDAHIKPAVPWWVSGIVSPLLIAALVSFAGYMLYLYRLHP